MPQELSGNTRERVALMMLEYLVVKIFYGLP